MNSPKLNATFNKKSNAACNNAMFTSGTLKPMREDMKRLYEAAKSLRDVEGQSAVARLLGESPQTVKNWESRGISKSGLLKAQKAIGCSAEWIASGLGAASDARAVPKEIDLSSHPDLQEVKRVRFKLSAGVSGFSVEIEEGNGKPIFFRRDWFAANGFRPDALFAVRVSGQSMETSLWDGDLVVINTADSKPTDGEVFAINYEGEMCIKRMKRDAGQWFACSDNADQRRYPPKHCTGDVKIIGKAVYKQSERV
ncbi:MAG: S24 family peptidase [Candidatus Dactylopiibacterium sp.]|nr:S24 family peptidase [Candidatus Dactylopiibacterium sp.]